MKTLLLAWTIIVASVFGQTLDSRLGDSLALVAIMNANPNSKLTWYTDVSIEEWDNVSCFPMYRVFSLNLSNCGIDSIPPEIGNLNKLRYLYLDSNNISSLPETIGNFKSLKALWLNNNNLEVLPEGICNFQYLDALNVTSNNLKSLPIGIGKLNRLTSMFASDNEITDLPAGVGSMDSLGFLDLSNNNIGNIPSSIGNSKKLRYLDFSSNDLESIPPEIGNVRTLTHLFFTKNKLKSIPSEIGNLNKLYSLSLAYNELVTLPFEIVILAYLYVLEVDSNYLAVENLPPYVASWLDSKSPNWLSLQKTESIPIFDSLDKITHQKFSIVAIDTYLGFSSSLPSGSILEIQSLSGRVIHRSFVSGLGVDVKGISKGVYIAKLTSEGMVYTLKFAVK